MILQGTRKGLPRVALTGQTSIGVLLPVSGVVVGGPHATNRCNSRVLRSPMRHVDRYPLGDADNVASIGTAVPSLPPCATPLGDHLPMSHDVPAAGCGAGTYSYEELVYVREMTLRRTKQRRRFNPGRRRDYDLRFSFPLCSQRLPFLSHDARVNMSHSVAND